MLSHKQKIFLRVGLSPQHCQYRCSCLLHDKKGKNTLLEQVKMRFFYLYHVIRPNAEHSTYICNPCHL